MSVMQPINSRPVRNVQCCRAQSQIWTDLIVLWKRASPKVSSTWEYIFFVSLCVPRPWAILSGPGGAEEVWDDGEWKDSLGRDPGERADPSGCPVRHVAGWWHKHQRCLHESSARQVASESITGTEVIVREYMWVCMWFCNIAKLFLWLSSGEQRLYECGHQ